MCCSDQILQYLEAGHIGWQKSELVELMLGWGGRHVNCGSSPVVIPEGFRICPNVQGTLTVFITHLNILVQAREPDCPCSEAETTFD